MNPDKQHCAKVLGINSESTLKKIMNRFYISNNLIQNSVNRKILNLLSVIHLNTVFQGTWQVGCSCILENLPQFFCRLKFLSCLCLLM